VEGAAQATAASRSAGFSGEPVVGGDLPRPACLVVAGPSRRHLHVRPRRRHLCGMVRSAAPGPRDCRLALRVVAWRLVGGRALRARLAE